MRKIYFYIIITVFIFAWCKSPEKTGITKADEHTLMAENLNRLLEIDSPKIRATLSEKSGTSVYMIIYICDDDECVKSGNYKLLGAILPENSSTKVMGEIISYNLARVLGVEEFYSPGAYIILRGAGLNKFRKMISDAQYTGWKEYNRKNLLRMTAAASELYCAYKKWDYTPCDLDKLESNGSINTYNILTEYISAENEKPGTENIKLSELSSNTIEGQGRAVDLAKQLSSIMILDILTGQWDRWSGGNIQAVISRGKMKIVAFDNGGTFKYSAELFNDYASILTRFDKKIVEILLNMDEFLNKKSAKSFLNYYNETDFRSFLGVIKGPDNLSNADFIWSMFKKNLSKLVKHIKNSEQFYGQDKCYF